MNISINPGITTNARNTFGTSWDGLMQGVAFDDPSVRNALVGGVIAADEVLAMFGGVAIYEFIPGEDTRAVLGSTIGRATGITGGKQVTGMAVFNQQHSSINSPQSEVPLASNGMTFNFYRLGSGARIAVKVDPALVSLEGGLINQQVSWAFLDQKLLPYRAANAQIAITSQTWSAGVVTVVTAAAHPFVVGDDVDLSGAVPTAYNGSKKITGSADNTHFTYAMPTDPGTSPASTPGVILAGGGAFPCKILSESIGNSMTVSYDPVTGFANWDRSGSAVVIQI